MGKIKHRAITALFLLLLVACTPSDSFVATSLAKTKKSQEMLVATLSPTPSTTITTTQRIYSLTETLTPTPSPDYRDSPVMLTYTAKEATQTFFESAISINHDEFLKLSFDNKALIVLLCKIERLVSPTEVVCSWSNTEDQFYIRSNKQFQNLDVNDEITIFGYLSGTALIGTELLEIPSFNVTYYNTSAFMLTATSVKGTETITEGAFEISITEFMTIPERYNAVWMKVPCEVVSINTVDYVRMICNWPVYDEIFFVEMAEPYQGIEEGELLVIYGTGCGWACANNDEENCMPCISWGIYEKKQ